MSSIISDNRINHSQSLSVDDNESYQEEQETHFGTPNRSSNPMIRQDDDQDDEDDVLYNSPLLPTTSSDHFNQHHHHQSQPNSQQIHHPVRLNSLNNSNKGGRVPSNNSNNNYHRPILSHQRSSINSFGSPAPMMAKQQLALQNDALCRQMVSAAATGNYHNPLQLQFSSQYSQGGGTGEESGNPIDAGDENEPGSYAYNRQMELSRAKLKATSRTSALLSGFAMVALVELEYPHTKTDTSVRSLFIPFGVVTTLLVSVHLLALMMSTCILPHLEISSTRDSPHVRLKWYIEASWFFSTCLGLLLFLLEIAIIFWIKFLEADYPAAAWVTTALLVPVFLLFILFTYNFYKKLTIHRVDYLKNQLGELDHEMRKLEQQQPLVNSNQNV